MRCALGLMHLGRPHASFAVVLEACLKNPMTSNDQAMISTSRCHHHPDGLKPHTVGERQQRSRLNENHAVDEKLSTAAWNAHG